MTNIEFIYQNWFEMNAYGWLENLQMLIAKYSYIGINADYSSLTKVELWGVYCYLSRLDEG
jgi:hypothetical protein